jgi:hypothetical protein
MANADLLWLEVISKWPEGTDRLKISSIAELAPIGTADISNRSSYDFAMLTLLSTQRRDFIVHDDHAAKQAIDNEVLETNRNNGIWRNYLGSFVRKA